MEDIHKPVHSIRYGKVEASCWLNGTASGYFYAVTFQRSYKDAATAEWGNSNSFGDRDLLNLALAAQDMFRWISEKKNSQATVSSQARSE